MKNSIICGMILFALGLLAPQTARSQGTLTYVSSLSPPSAGSAAVGSDSWVAGLIQTGNNPGGYALDSVQFALTPASGAPSGFEVELYSGTEYGPAVLPESSLSTLIGSSDPETGGFYTYAASGLTLSPSTDYYLVVTAGTAVASGAYGWSFANSAPIATGGWIGAGFFATSTDGSSWRFISGSPQYALNATAVPEPDTLELFGFPALLFFARRRWQAKTQSLIAR